MERSTEESRFKGLGAGYLFYLAWQAFLSMRRPLGVQAQRPLSAGRLYRRGILMNLSNPKVLIFFLAFLPQFADPGIGGVALQLISLGVLFIMASLLVFGTLAWSAGWLGERFRRSTAYRRWLDGLTGVLFLLLALRLAAG